MLARKELSRLQARKEDLLRQVERERSEVVTAFQGLCDRTQGAQRVGRVLRAALKWQAFVLPMALLILPRKVRRLFGLVSEATRAFHLAKTASAFWREATERR
jgi:hypothetical protein